MRFGRITITKNIHESEEASTTTSYTERIKIESHADLLAEILKALDKYKKAEINQLKFDIIEKQNKPQYIEVSYCKTT